MAAAQESLPARGSRPIDVNDNLADVTDRKAQAVLRSLQIDAGPKLGGGQVLKKEDDAQVELYVYRGAWYQKDKNTKEEWTTANTRRRKKAKEAEAADSRTAPSLSAAGEVGSGSSQKGHGRKRMRDIESDAGDENLESPMRSVPRTSSPRDCAYGKICPEPEAQTALAARSAESISPVTKTPKHQHRTGICNPSPYDQHPIEVRRDRDFSPGLIDPRESTPDDVDDNVSVTTSPQHSHQTEICHDRDSSPGVIDPRETTSDDVHDDNPVISSPQHQHQTEIRTTSPHHQHPTEIRRCPGTPDPEETTPEAGETTPDDVDDDMYPYDRLQRAKDRRVIRPKPKARRKSGLDDATRDAAPKSVRQIRRVYDSDDTTRNAAPHIMHPAEQIMCYAARGITDRYHFPQLEVSSADDTMPDARRDIISRFPRPSMTKAGRVKMKARKAIATTRGFKTTPITDYEIEHDVSRVLLHNIQKMGVLNRKIQPIIDRARVVVDQLARERASAKAKTHQAIGISPPASREQSRLASGGLADYPDTVEVRPSMQKPAVRTSSLETVQPSVKPAQPLNETLQPSVEPATRAPISTPIVSRDKAGNTLRWSLDMEKLGDPDNAAAAIYHGRLEGESKQARRRRIRREKELVRSWALEERPETIA